MDAAAGPRYRNGPCPRVLERLGRSSGRRWESLKYRILRPLGHLLEGGCRRGELLLDTSSPFDLRAWIFHDENWIRVRHRKEHRAIVSAGLPFYVSDNWQEPTNELTAAPAGDLQIDARVTPDRWIYLYLDPQTYPWEDYSWSFSVCRHTPFRELQFGFRYQDFYNRYRYRFEADYIFFDKVVQGRFYNALSAIPFHMELGVSYDVLIEACRNHFRCIVNGNAMSRDYDWDNRFPRGSIALILWEDDGRTDIRATVGRMSVHKLER